MEVCKQLQVYQGDEWGYVVDLDARMTCTYDQPGLRHICTRHRASTFPFYATCSAVCPRTQVFRGECCRGHGRNCALASNSIFLVRAEAGSEIPRPLPTVGVYVRCLSMTSTRHNIGKSGRLTGDAEGEAQRRPLGSTAGRDEPGGPEVTGSYQGYVQRWCSGEDCCQQGLYMLALQESVVAVPSARGDNISSAGTHLPCLAGLAVPVTTSYIVVNSEWFNN